MRSTQPLAPLVNNLQIRLHSITPRRFLPSFRSSAVHHTAIPARRDAGSHAHVAARADRRCTARCQRSFRKGGERRVDRSDEGVCRHRWRSVDHFAVSYQPTASRTKVSMSEIDEPEPAVGPQQQDLVGQLNHVQARPEAWGKSQDEREEGRLGRPSRCPGTGPSRRPPGRPSAAPGKPARSTRPPPAARRTRRKATAPGGRSRGQHAFARRTLRAPGHAAQPASVGRRRRACSGTMPRSITDIITPSFIAAPFMLSWTETI